MTTAQKPIEQRLLDLWTLPPDSRDDPVAAFRALYTDPVTINGAEVAVDDLVARARALHTAFGEHEIELVERIESPGKRAIAFRHTARHVGPWSTPLGELAPTGRTVTGLGIDLLTVDAEGRVSAIWVLADELQRVLQVHRPA